MNKYLKDAIAPVSFDYIMIIIIFFLGFIIPDVLDVGKKKNFVI